MLALLLSAGQVVVLCNRTHVYFFCHGQAYVRPIALGFLGLPTHKQHRTRAVWALIDMDFGSQEPPISGDLEVWPIQASSPNPAQWGKWRKQLRAAMWGMPLWDMDELMEGYGFILPLCLGRPVRHRLSSTFAAYPLCLVTTSYEVSWRGSSRSLVGQRPLNQVTSRLTLFWRFSTRKERGRGWRQ